MYENQELIQEYADKKRAGTDYSVIRKELAAKGLSKEEITEMVKKIDEIVLKHPYTKSTKLNPRDLTIVGYVLLFGGGIFAVTIGSGFISVPRGVYISTWIVATIGYILILIARKIKGRK